MNDEANDKSRWDIEDWNYNYSPDVLNRWCYPWQDTCDEKYGIGREIGKMNGVVPDDGTLLGKIHAVMEKAIPVNGFRTQQPYFNHLLSATISKKRILTDFDIKYPGWKTYRLHISDSDDGGCEMETEDMNLAFEIWNKLEFATREELIKWGFEYYG